MLDGLLLLKKGGETVYLGELGEHSSSLISYISSVPGSVPIADNANPATWVLEQARSGRMSSTPKFSECSIQTIEPHQGVEFSQ